MSKASNTEVMLRLTTPDLNICARKETMSIAPFYLSHVYE